MFSNWLVAMYSEPPPGWLFPTYGPPTIVLYAPAIIFTIPLILCIVLMTTANRRFKAKMEKPTVYRYRDETIIYTGDYVIHEESEDKKKKKFYTIPTECPTCNHSLSTNEIEWIGPLQAKCPYCGGTIEAEVRE